MKTEHRPLTQEELLEEAAQTELENSASVAALMAAEEEFRARAAVRKAKYCGPLLRYHSLKVAGESVVRPTRKLLRDQLIGSIHLIKSKDASWKQDSERTAHLTRPCCTM